jgi:hypothetical protein
MHTQARIDGETYTDLYVWEWRHDELKANEAAAAAVSDAPLRVVTFAIANFANAAAEGAAMDTNTWAAEAIAMSDENASTTVFHLQVCCL